MYLLLVEDDLHLGQALLKLLGRHYRVLWVRTLAAARSRFADADCDVVLLDLGLPDGDGLEWLRALRADACATPVLVVTARDALDERVLGLDTGADDYLVKPFEPEELLARIRVLLRRRAGSAAPRVAVGAVAYAQDERRFYVDDVPIALPPMEHQLLAVLVLAGGKPVSRERLMQQLYGGGEGAGSNTLEVHVHGLRKAIGRERIETVRGFGYRLLPT